MNHEKYGESKRFYLEGVERSFEGWDNGNRWNGWAMPMVTKETRDEIVREVIKDVDLAEMIFRQYDAEWVIEVCELKLTEPNDAGLISIGAGWCYWWDGE